MCLSSTSISTVSFYIRSPEWHSIRLYYTVISTPSSYQKHRNRVRIMRHSITLATAKRFVFVQTAARSSTKSTLNLVPIFYAVGAKTAKYYFACCWLRNKLLCITVAAHIYTRHLAIKLSLAHSRCHSLIMSHLHRETAHAVLHGSRKWLHNFYERAVRGRSKPKNQRSERKRTQHYSLLRATAAATQLLFNTIKKKKLSFSKPLSVRQHKLA